MSFLVSIFVSYFKNKRYDGSCAERKEIGAIGLLCVSHVTTRHFLCSFYGLGPLSHGATGFPVDQDSIEQGGRTRESTGTLYAQTTSFVI